MFFTRIAALGVRLVAWPPILGISAEPPPGAGQGSNLIFGVWR
jgi:hypothetical protein